MKYSTSATFEKSQRWVQVDSQGNALGDVQEVNVLVKEISRSDFMITYLASMVSMLDTIGNKKMKVVKYILQNMDKSTNKLTETTTEIAEHCGVSRVCVSETLKILTNAGFIARKSGVVMLSPKIVHKGNAQKERYLLTKFKEMKGDVGKVEDVGEEEV